MERSTDGGVTWQRVCDYEDACSGPSDGPHAFLQLPSGHAHAGRILAGPLFYSDDDGLTWTRATHDVPVSPVLLAFAALPSGRVLAVGSWGMAVSDDGGTTWQTGPIYQPYRYEVYNITTFATPGSVQSGAPSCGLADPTLCEGAIAIGIDAQEYYHQVWLTNDGGRSWSRGPRIQQLYDGVASGEVAGLFDLGRDPTTGLSRGVTVLGRGFVYTTADGGQSWEVVARAPILPPDEGAKSVASAIIAPDGRLYAAVRSNNGFVGEYVYRTTEPVTAAFPVSAEAPPAEALGLSVSVRPNPSQRAVEVAVTAAARVVVVDALGREVAALDAEPGRTVRLDVSGWSPGVYVVRAVSGRERASARLGAPRRHTVATPCAPRRRATPRRSRPASSPGASR